ncbi:MAG: hypothetical protein EZS28_027576 [Streblomastix strix]|uniref:Uncharacterized protein n=1 Tax=Streblomastix strix TaxID=222440 RepID=A0A5J4V1T8_9EUKA|nr:MAG: hypothetical protein EZS28_027576 [Streblomastix strix]
MEVKQNNIINYKEVIWVEQSNHFFQTARAVVNQGMIRWLARKFAELNHFAETSGNVQQFFSTHSDDSVLA